MFSPEHLKMASYNNIREKNGHRGTFFNIRLELLVCLFLVLSILTVYWQVRNYDFVNLDDNVYVTDNPHVKAGLTLESIAWSFSGGNQCNWHPLTWVSHMIDVSLYGLNPGRHHLTNVFFHIINTLLLFLILRRMTNDLWKSGFVAALFALHPLHVESVAWVSERKDVLCAFFWFSSMWSYFWYTEKPCVSRYMLILLFLIMGIMSKPMIATLPFALLLLDYWPLGRFSSTISKSQGKGIRQSDLHLVLEKVPLLVIVAASCVVTYLTQKSGGALMDSDVLPFGPRIGNALVSYVRYMGKAIWPQELCAFYPHPGSWPLWQTASAAFLLIFISLGALLTVRKLPYFAVGWLWYLGTLVPVIGLVQVGNQSMADRYTYIPAIGIFIIIAWGVPFLFAKWRCRKWILATASIALLSILMTTTLLQVQYWTNSITLFVHALDVTKGSYLAHSNLGNALARRGRLDEAITHYSEALRISPSKAAEVHNNLGAALIVKGRFEEALPHLQYALQKMPDNANARKNLQQVLEGIEKSGSSENQKK